MAFIHNMSLVILNNIETIALLFLSKISILPELLFGLHRSGVITLEEIDTLEDYLHFDSQGLLFAKESCKWIAKYISDTGNSYSDKMYTTRLFIQYLYLAYINSDLRNIYDERQVNIDFILQ